MSREIINTGILTFLFLLLFAFAEFLYYKLKVKAGLTRNIVHFGTGLITLLFPLMLASHWLVLFLCTCFAAILLLSLKFNFLKSINSIDRISYGSILYPVAVYGCYLIYDYTGKNLLFFYLPVLTLAICDPLAGICGKRWPRGIFYIGNTRKSITGVLSFFISSSIVTLVLFNILSAKSINHVLPVTFLIATAASITEALSIKGFDNITIPSSVVLILFLWR